LAGGFINPGIRHAQHDLHLVLEVNISD
jgi:hypothetical protein